MTEHQRRAAMALRFLRCASGATAILFLALACGLGQAAEPAATEPPHPSEAAAESPAPPEPEALLKAIAQRENELAQRADELAKQEQRLKILDQDLRAMMDKYVKLREEVSQKAKPDKAASQASDEAQYAQLAKVYEQMAPDDAAARIDKMNESVALKILAAAKPKATAKILTGLPAPKAARLSEQLAEKPR
jgi:flagellar motility protein MotE (MotC chaperone)